MHANKTTRGWTLKVERKGGSSVWVSLVDLKHSNPVELSENSVANKLQKTLRSSDGLRIYLISRWTATSPGSFVLSLVEIILIHQRQSLIKVLSLGIARGLHSCLQC